MMENIICMEANMFRIYLVYRFMKIFFAEPKVEKKREFFMYVAYFVINTWFYIEFHLAWVNIINTLIGIVLLSSLYTTSIKKGFFTATLIYILNMICDIVSTVPFVNYMEGENTNQILFVVGDLLFLICELLSEKIVNIKKDSEQQNLPLILVPICSIGIIFYMIYSGHALSSEIVIVSIGLMMINFFVLYIYNILLRVLTQSYENEILSQKVMLYSNQLDIIMQNERQMSTLRHDMKHHLNELKLLSMQKESKEIQMYIENMEAFIQNPNEIICSGNIEIDSLLNYMLKKAQEKLKVMDVKVKLPKDILHSFDINIILGNLLENAIEASVMTDDKILKGSISLRKDVLIIRIENSYNGNIKKGEQGFITTKNDKQGHGIGLKSVQNIVEKYNGIMEISEGELFCVKLVLYLSDKNI